MNGDVTGQHGLAAVVVALLTGGGMKYAVDAWKDWRHSRSARPAPGLQQNALIDANLLTVAKARDELAEDLASERAENDRLRRVNAEQEERAQRREAALREEIERLEAKLRALLDEVSSLKIRHGFDPA